MKKVLPDLGIVLLLIVVYLPALQGGFIWDDDSHLTQNPNVVGESGLRGIWTSSDATYYPLVLTTFRVLHALFGLNPLPYHLLNVLVHVLCVIVLRHVLLALNLPSAAAWLGAVLWGLHPVQVESVAWITELKNTQSALFYLLAILLFLKRQRRILYVLFLLCATFALLSKTSTVVLPVVLALCAWWVDRQWNWSTLKALAPVFLLSVAAGVWTIWEQKFHSGALGSEWVQSFSERAVVAGYSFWFYLGKLIWPHPLIFLYPRWEVHRPGLIAFLPGVAAVALLALLWTQRKGSIRPVFFAFAYFSISLFPVLDFFDVYFFRYSFVGDHFQYLASMGPVVLAAVAIEQLRNRRLQVAVSVVLISVLGLLATQHAQVFRDDETLWRDTVRKNPRAWLAYNNLASIYLDRDNIAAAIVELEITLRLYPHYSEGHANLANALYESGRIDEAITHFKLALEGEPDYGRIHNYLGVALMSAGKLDEGMTHIRKAIEIDPGDATAHENLGIALMRSGRAEEGIAEFKDAVRINPRSLDSRMRYATALFSQSRYPEAASAFEEILRISPNHAEARQMLDELRGPRTKD